MDKDYYVYVLASRRNGTLYVGITSNLIKRIWEHKNKAIEGFTQKYNSRIEMGIDRKGESRMERFVYLYICLITGLPDRVGQ